MASATWGDRRSPIGLPAAVPAERPEPRVDLRDLLRILRRRRAVILGTTALLVAAALAYGLLAKPLYTATAQILVDPRERRIVGSEVNPSALPADGGIAQVESQLKVLGSDGVLLRAVARAGLAADPEFGSEPDGIVATLKRELGFGGTGAEPADRKAVRLLRKRLALKRADKAFVLDLAVASENPDKAARIADAVVRAYLDDAADARAEANRRASAALTARLDDLRRKVEAAENRVESFKAENGIVGASGRLVNEQQLTESNAQLVAARARTAEAKARYEQIGRLQKGPAESAATAEAAASPAIVALRAQIAEIVRQAADLKTQYGPRHPAVATVEAQLRDARRLVSAELARIADSARNDYERARANETALEAGLRGLKGDAVQTGRAFVRLRELEREAEAERAVYGAFLTRARETGEQETIDTSNARVISAASPPESRSWPPRLLLLAAALFGGLGLGTGLALGREYLDDVATSGPRLAEATGLPLLSVAPRPAPPTAERRALLAAPGGGAAPAGGAAPDGGAASAVPRARADGRGTALAMRRLRHLLRGRSGRPDRPVRQVFAIAGSGPEDTALVALGLAEAAVAEGEAVLVVDGGPQGALAARLGPERSTDLATALGGPKSCGGALRGPVGAVLVAVGGLARSPDPEADLARLLAGPGVAFDLVLIDCGGDPAGEAAAGAAALADDVLLVGEAGLTREARAVAAVGALRGFGAPLRGLVFLDGGSRAA